MRAYLYLYIIISTFLIACERDDEIPIAYGLLEPTHITVYSQTQGRINYFPIKVGEMIEMGRIVALIDTTYLLRQKDNKYEQLMKITSKMNNFFSNFALLEEQLENAYKDKKRIEFLFNDNAATQKEIDDINKRIELIKSQIEILERTNSTIISEVRRLEKDIVYLEDLIVKCLIKNSDIGVVREKYLELGDTVEIGTPLYKLQDPKTMTIKSFFNADYLNLLKKYQKLEVKVMIDNQSYMHLDGVVINISDESVELPEKIAPLIGKRDNLYPVDILVNNGEKLSDGQISEIFFLYKK